MPFGERSRRKTNRGYACGKVQKWGHHCREGEGTKKTLLLSLLAEAEVFYPCLASGTVPLSSTWGDGDRRAAGRSWQATSFVSSDCSRSLRD